MFLYKHDQLLHSANHVGIKKNPFVSSVSTLKGISIQNFNFLGPSKLSLAMWVWWINLVSEWVSDLIKEKKRVNDSFCYSVCIEVLLAALEFYIGLTVSLCQIIKNPKLAWNKHWICNLPSKYQWEGVIFLGVNQRNP